MKKLFSALSFLTFIGFMSSAVAPAARADAWDQRTIVTFQQPVEIPHMILGPGTYVMKRAEPRYGDIVQFSNENESHVFATVMAIPTYRVTPTDRTVITFEERAANSPRAIKKWFYPGENYGEELLYPKTQQIAAVAPPAPAAAEPRLQPRVPEPQTQPVPQAAVTPAPTPAPVEVAQAATPAEQPKPSTSPAPEPAKELPKTASDLPWIGLLGSLSVAAGVFLRRKVA